MGQYPDSRKILPGRSSTVIKEEVKKNSNPHFSLHTTVNAYHHPTKVNNPNLNLPKIPFQNSYKVIKQPNNIIHNNQANQTFGNTVSVISNQIATNPIMINTLQPNNQNLISQPVLAAPISQNIEMKLPTEPVQERIQAINFSLMPQNIYSLMQSQQLMNIGAHLRSNENTPKRNFVGVYSQVPQNVTEIQNIIKSQEFHNTPSRMKEILYKPISPFRQSNPQVINHNISQNINQNFQNFRQPEINTQMISPIKNIKENTDHLKEEVPISTHRYSVIDEERIYSLNKPVNSHFINHKENFREEQKDQKASFNIQDTIGSRNKVSNINYWDPSVNTAVPVVNVLLNSDPNSSKLVPKEIINKSESIQIIQEKINPTIQDNKLEDSPKIRTNAEVPLKGVETVRKSYFGRGKKTVI